jgi:RsiW-degrading membrane proteinase PrsW (M82 family)
MQNNPTLIDQMVSFFLSAFQFPGLAPHLILIAIALGLLFGAVWLLCYWPPLRTRPWLLAVAVISALLTWLAIAFIQIPLQSFYSLALLQFFDRFTIINWLLLAGIPSVLLSGLVQEAAKLAPVVFYWVRQGRYLTPKAGLIAGAVSGAGFGVFEAIWIHNTMFAAGWSLLTLQSSGPIAFLGFVERFFAVAFHIAASALAGYGLAKGKAWQFYLIAAFLHGALNYGVILLQTGLLNSITVEIYTALFACAVTAVALWLRWRRQRPETEDNPLEP